jgi:hypothetical protein
VVLTDPELQPGTIVEAGTVAFGDLAANSAGTETS